jgi:flagellar biosynthesis protein FlhF
MNVNRFTARTSREALALVRQAFGNEAVVLSTRPCAEGVEVLAMPGDGMQHIEKLARPASNAVPERREVDAQPARPERSDVSADVERLSMSTLSFQDYVRERMLKRRQAALQMPPPAPPAIVEPPPLHEEIAAPRAAVASVASDEPHASRDDMLAELRSMKGLIEERFGALAFIDRLQRQPAQARLAQKLLDAGFSPALVRKLADAMPADVADEMAWAGAVLERNLLTHDNEPALEDCGGIYALIGSTGVGKTTSTAKIAAAFAAKHGATNLGLVTLDAYRVAAHEQLRAYGRILGVPVHTAHDRATLEDLLDMLGRSAINRLLVVNAAAQGETIEDVLLAYRASQCAGVVLSKLDEAMKLGPALDALIRHRLKIVGVANGQRVPEDWHRLSAASLLQRALRSLTGSAWRIDANDVNLVFAASRWQPSARAALSA